MKRILKKITRFILYLIAGITGLLLLYILFNLNLFHKTKALAPEKLNAFLQAIEKEEGDPYRFVADKFDNHSIVFLGELHKRKQDLAFFSNLIPYLYKEKKITIIGWEFGAVDFQQEADSVVGAPEFDRAKAIAIMRKTLYYWCYEEYLSIFKAIWQLNKTIPPGEDKVRFLQLNKPYNPRRLISSDSLIREEESLVNFDNTLPGIVENEVIAKNKKILIYCGLHHALTKFHTPKFFFLKDKGRAGQQLYEKYPDKIFQASILSPYPPRWYVYNELTHKENYTFVFPFDGIFNQLYDSLKRPFAVSSSDPAFANLKDYNSFYAFDNWGGIKLKNFCDGAIMLESFDKTQPVSIITDWVLTEADVAAVKNQLPEEVAKKLKTPADFMNFINPDTNIRAMRSIHELKKFW